MTDLELYEAAYGPDELRERLASWKATDPDEYAQAMSAIEARHCEDQRDETGRVPVLGGWAE